MRETLFISAIFEDGQTDSDIPEKPQNSKGKREI